MGTVALLADPYVFSQTPLLSGWEFLEEARDRGVRLTEAHLELLHRRRLLQPFYEVHPRQIAAPVEYPEVFPDGWTALHVVHQAHEEGRLSDPASRRWSPWPSRRSRRAFYYSRYQLLAIRGIDTWFTASQLPGPDLALSWDLEPLDREQREASRRERFLVWTLEAISGRHRGNAIGLHSIRRPFITHAPWSADDYWRYVNEDSPVRLVDEQELPQDTLLRQADCLLASASVIDPLGEWHRIVRLADPETWGRLRLDALMANELRVAAEVIAHYVDSSRGVASESSLLAPTPGLMTPRDERIRVTPAERWDALKTFGLSNRASLVLAVEGQSEALIAERVLHEIAPDPGHLRIEIVLLQGNQRDVTLLARAVAAPELDADAPRYARLTVPLTTLLVMVDAEHDYETEEQTLAKHGAMVESIWESLPRRLQSSDMGRMLAQMLLVRTWRHEFEYAHWSDDELATALQNVSPHAAAMPPDDLRRNLQICRRNGGRIKSVWKQWPAEPSKVALAGALWPTLAERIVSQASDETVPIVRYIREGITVAADMVRIGAVRRATSA